MNQTESPEENYRINKAFVEKMQPIAIEQFYTNVWPGVDVMELDIDLKNKLAGVIDKGGADKLLRFKNGNIAFLAQRFRGYEYKKYDQFTIRDSELSKSINSLENSGFIASYYAYGFSNTRESSFVKFRIFLYKETLIYILPNLRKYPWLPNKDGKHPFRGIPFKNLPNELFLLKYPECNQLTLWDSEIRTN